jgi:hypothetical protein
MKNMPTSGFEVLIFKTSPQTLKNDVKRVLMEAELAEITIGK